MKMSMKEQHATGEQWLHKTQQMAQRKDRQIFREKLKEFPHHFQLKDYSHLSLQQKRNILDKLQSEIMDCTDYRTPEEDTYISNFIAFLLFLTNDVDKAVEEINKVLTSPNDDTNIAALANMAVIKWEIGDRMEGETIVKRLQELREKANFEDKVIDAKAEMAYSYSRMGMSFAPKAVDIFEEVVKARPHNYTWKFGLALVLRRFTQFAYKFYFRVSSKLASQKLLRAFDLLLEIKNSDASDERRAQALTELGNLLGPEWYLSEASTVMERAKKEGIKAEECYEEALKLAPQSVRVLTYSGKFFTNKNQLYRSSELLERAIAIKSTTTAHHCLGKTYIKMVRREKRQSTKERRYGDGQGSESYSWRAEPGNNTSEGLRKEWHGNEQRPVSSEAGWQSRNKTTFEQRTSGAYVYPKKPHIRPGLLHLDQEYVKAAIYHFQEAIEKSPWDSPLSKYELGKVYILAEHDDQALKYLSEFINESDSRGSLLQLINAHEYCGKIYFRKSVRMNNVEEEKCADEGFRLLQIALMMECQIVSSVSICEPEKAAISFSDISGAAIGKLPNMCYEVGKLFEMIKDCTEHLNVLNEISVFRLQDTQDPKILEKKLQSYISRELYDHALLFLSLLEITAEGKLINQWSDPHLPRRCRLLAARKKLVNVIKAPSGSIDDKMIKRCFVQAVQPKVSQTDEMTPRKYVDDGWSEDEDEKWWHVMILYNQDDDDMKVKGSAIKDILQKDCGLRVTCMSDDDNDLSDDNEDEQIVENAKNSLILLVLCGPEEHSGGCSETVMQILKEVRSSADCEPRTVLVLLIDNARPPDNLHPDRCLQCPSPLFGLHAPYTPELIEAIYRLCCFLADVPSDDQ